MAAPGDPQTHDDHDDLIGFTSPSSLAGQARRGPVEPEPEPEHWVSSEPEDGDADLFGAFDKADFADVEDVAEPVPPADPEPEPDTVGPLFDAPVVAAETVPAPEAEAEPAPAPLAANLDFDTPPAPPFEPLPAAAPDPVRNVFMPSTPYPNPSPRPVAPPADFGQSRKPEPLQGAMGLYAVYALILFAVPTLGVSALIALLAVTGRSPPTQALAQSHVLFQQRTLWIAAAVGVLGVVLIAVNIGVFVLFVMALWVLFRGAAGLVRLASGRPIDNPKTWLI